MLNGERLKINCMKIERFEDIITWQKAKESCIDIYSEFGGSKDFVFKGQILRASL